MVYDTAKPEFFSENLKKALYGEHLLILIYIFEY